MSGTDTGGEAGAPDASDPAASSAHAKSPREESLALAIVHPSLESLADVRRFVGQSLTALHCLGAVESMTLAVDEVLANLVTHGFAGEDDGSVRITVQRNGSDAIIVVEDTGLSFDPSRAIVPDLDLDWESRPVGGLGWFLVRQLVDRLQYETTPHGNTRINRLTLTKTNAADALRDDVDPDVHLDVP
jgi:anti-sigma regulatory factor (Ser/Thr protein kinase)